MHVIQFLISLLRAPDVHVLQMIQAVWVLLLGHPNIITSLGRVHPDKNRRDVCGTRELNVYYLPGSDEGADAWPYENAQE